MKYSELILLIGTLNGCAEPEVTPVKDEVAADYRCAAAQMKRVKREARECVEAFPSWADRCELEAKRRFCERVER
jgi:hypothetical protein